MSDQRFSSQEAIRFGWETVKAHIPFFLGFLALAFVAEWIPSFFVEHFKHSNPIISIVFSLLSMFIQLVIALGVAKTSLRLCDHEEGQISDLWAYPHLFPRYLGASFLAFLAIAGGFVLLIVPGLIMGVRLQFFSYLIVDRDLPMMDALKTSFALTKGATWDLMVFGFWLALINLAGALCLLVGLFITIPLTMVAAAYVYRNLLSSFNIPGEQH